MHFSGSTFLTPAGDSLSASSFALPPSPALLPSLLLRR
jgi:hypothetical protein